jgi:16S rRNA processing protein RimM
VSRAAPRAAEGGQLSPKPERFLAIGRVVRPQGRRGEVVAEVLTDFPARFQEVRQVFLGEPCQAPRPAVVERAWPHKGRVVLKFAGVDSIEAASRLRGCCLLIPREERAPLPPDHYYLWELEGCRVVVEHAGAAHEVGTVTEVEPTGGVGLLHVETPRGEVLIPLAQAICTRIDPAAKTIVIDPPEDLLELNLEAKS